MAVRHRYDSVVVDRFRYADDDPRNARSHKSVASLGHSLCAAVLPTPIGKRSVIASLVLLMSVSFDR